MDIKPQLPKSTSPHHQGAQFVIDEVFYEKNKDMFTAETVQLITDLILRYGQRANNLVSARKTSNWKKFTDEDRQLRANRYAKLKKLVQENPENYRENIERKKAAREEGGATLVYQGQKDRHNFHAQEFVDTLAKSTRQRIEEQSGEIVFIDTDRPNPPLNTIHDTEDAGTINEQDIVNNIRMSKEKRHNNAIRRPSGLEFPEINDKVAHIRLANGEVVAINRFIFQYALDIAHGNREILWADIHNGKEAKFLNEMADYTEQQYGKTFNIQSNGIKFRFLIETGAAFVAFLSIVASCAKRIREIVIGGWDAKAWVLNDERELIDGIPPDGIPDITTGQEFVAHACAALDIPCCGSMFVYLWARQFTEAQILDPLTRQIYNDQIDANNQSVYHAEIKQKTEDARLHDNTWLAQQQRKLFDICTWTMKNTEKADLSHIGKMSDKKLEDALTARTPYDMTYEEFIDYVDLLVQYNIKVLNSGDLCHAHVNYSAIKFDPNDPRTLQDPRVSKMMDHLLEIYQTGDEAAYKQQLAYNATILQKGEMHDPATAWHRIGGLLRQVILREKMLRDKDGNLIPCNKSLLNMILKKITAHVIQSLNLDMNNSVHRTLLREGFASARALATTIVGEDNYAYAHFVKKYIQFQQFKREQEAQATIFAHPYVKQSGVGIAVGVATYTCSHMFHRWQQQRHAQWQQPERPTKPSSGYDFAGAPVTGQRQMTTWTPASWQNRRGMMTGALAFPNGQYALKPSSVGSLMRRGLSLAKRVIKP